MAEKIIITGENKDSLKTAAPKLNDAIDQSNEAITKATSAEQTANLANTKSDDTQQQLNNIVINNGQSDAEVLQARGTYSVLNERLSATDAQLADITKLGINASNPPGGLSKLIYSGDEGSKLNDILSYAKTNNIDKVYVTGNLTTSITIDVPSGVRLIGLGYQAIAITGTTTSMYIVQMDNAVDSSIEDIEIVGDNTMTGIRIQNYSARYVLKRVNLVGLSVGLNITYSWSGQIDSVNTTNVTTGLRLESQSNQITFKSCNIKSNGAIVKLTSASSIKFITCQLTQFNNPDVIPFQFTGSFSNVSFDTCYLEGLSTTETLLSVGAGVGGVTNIEFNNCKSIGVIPKLIYASSSNDFISKIIFKNNSMEVNQIFDYLSNAHSFVFENNTFNNLLTKPSNDNFAINGNLISWNGNTPNGVQSGFGSTLTKQTDGRLNVTAGTSGANIIWNFKPFRSKYISVEFEASSSIDTSINFKINDTYSVVVPIDTTHKKVRLFLNLTDFTLFDRARIITTNDFTISDLKVSNATDIDNVSLDKKYLSNATPTENNFDLGDTLYNASPSSGGYLGWTCVTSGNPGTWKGFGLIEA
jgi:hypothetical protein